MSTDFPGPPAMPLARVRIDETQEGPSVERPRHPGDTQQMAPAQRTVPNVRPVQVPGPSPAPDAARTAADLPGLPRGQTVTPPDARWATAPLLDAKARAGGLEVRAVYCCAVDRYRLMFARALLDRGFAAMDYDHRLDRALDRIDESGARSVLLLHGNLPGETFGDALIARIRQRTNTPILLVGFPQGVVDPHMHQDVAVLPPPVTVAAVADAANRLKPTPQSSLVRRLLELPHFSRHGTDAVAWLVDNAEPRPLYPQQVAYGRDEAADALYFVLAGGVMLTLGDQEVDGVGIGGIFGEGALLDEGSRRPTAAVAREATVLLRITPENLAAGPASFRALVFELIARTLAPRTRAPR